MRFMRWYVWYFLCVMGGILRGDPHFVVLILTYNNERYVVENMVSALQQEYPYMRVLVCNDASTDGTEQGIAAAIAQCHAYDWVYVQHNTYHKGALRNLYECIHDYVKDDEIVVMLDGDDYFPHTKVVTYLADMYADPALWLTYGNYRCKKSGAIGQYVREIPAAFWEQGLVRTYQKKFSASHVRTFYGWLFKKIKREDLLYEDEFYPMAYDVAIMLPMLEMARFHYRCISEVLYVYNDANPRSDHRVNWQLQRRMADHILQRAPYAPV